MPYYHAELRSDMSIRPCCQYSTTWIDSLDAYNNVDRTDFEQPILPKACDPCNIKNSYKQIKILEFLKLGLRTPVQPQLSSINLFLDNVCSNSCLMCSASNSTTIGSLLKAQVKTSFNLDTIDLHLESLRWITLLGGEPLQSSNLSNLCAKLKRAKKLEHVNIITSLAKPTKGNIQALSQLDVPLNFRVSIDGDHELNTWIRGYKEKDWLETYSKIERLGTISWQITLGSYNVFALPECLQYIETLKADVNILPCIVYDPQECCIKQLDSDLKNKTKIKLDRYKKTIYNYRLINTALELLKMDSTIDWNECKKYINRIPFLRNESKDIDYFIKKYLTK